MKHIDLYFSLTLTNVFRMQQVDLFIALTLSKTCGGKGGPYGEYYGGVITHFVFIANSIFSSFLSGISSSYLWRGAVGWVLWLRGWHCVGLLWVSNRCLWWVFVSEVHDHWYFHMIIMSLLLSLCGIHVGKQHVLGMRFFWSCTRVPLTIYKKGAFFSKSYHTSLKQKKEK